MLVQTNRTVQMRKITADMICSGCGICAVSCRKRNILVVNGEAQIMDFRSCEQCKECARYCTFGGIQNLLIECNRMRYSLFLMRRR